MEIEDVESAEFVVTVDFLAKAIQNGLSRPKRRLSMEEAKMTAEHVLNFFGYGDRIIDNMLEPEDRDTFYILEDLAILKTEREETTLWDGREWRIHYWLLNKERIYELVYYKQEEEKEEDIEDIYTDLPDELWIRG
ncbi:DUF6015 family protein [Candidatus Aciduliprofundum boonei]|uniref:Uncharacterized protein n=1 Tax=Aciduliprofundum boonei (strain DSM 19572 / T469) TaxID=439481 RepID=B5IAE8_ACIB4|nr:DUF6015 family protein [Candidatus Aciduliprofundum boonei]ADD08209.1 conserved hypothetical protein [Aciduliprofundum boonei T469]EDY36826.1 hypothetical protein ABOONEI_1747 [Aciduliprofundum boonei T469]HII55761.1 hypothetical protein [Candidatus Aciduliprofundum boonei]